MKLGKLTSVGGKQTDSCSGRFLVSPCLSSSFLGVLCSCAFLSPCHHWLQGAWWCPKQGGFDMKPEIKSRYRWVAELGSWGCFYLPHWYSLLMLPSKLRGCFELCQIFWFGKTWSSNSIFKVHWSRQSEKFLSSP